MHSLTFRIRFLLSLHLNLLRTKQIDQFTIYPWIHQVSNVKDTSEQLREVRIPDVDPSSLPPDSEFGCAAGDFLDIAKEESQWDAVVTCFFIDTAHNVIEYMESIFGMLRPGGIWINLGPLLYHYTDSPELSLELTLDQVLHVAKKLGFDFQEQRTITCNYTKKHSSMMHVNYEAEFWVAKKPKS
jgi:carnosine N-methyltransferase